MAFTPDNATGLLNGVTEVDIVAAPVGGVAREVANITFHNRDTAAVDLTLNYDDGGTKRRLTKQNMAAAAVYVYQVPQVLRVNKKLTAVLDAGVTANQPSFVANYADKS